MDDKHETPVEQCPVCDREYDETLQLGESTRTPGAIEMWWTICVGQNEVYIHDDGV